VPPKSNANYAWILNMVSKLSVNGVAGFILSNGALSGRGEEYKIRKKLIENNLVETIVILPGSMFYTTDISVSIWIINRNKKEHQKSIGQTTWQYRDREEEILFMDLRQIGIPFEKKFIQFSEEQIDRITATFHQWQIIDGNYKDEPEFSYSAHLEEIIKKDYSLVPSKYIEFINVDIKVDFDAKMKELQEDVASLLEKQNDSNSQLKDVFKNLGYEL